MRSSDTYEYMALKKFHESAFISSRCNYVNKYWNLNLKTCNCCIDLSVQYVHYDNGNMLLTAEADPLQKVTNRANHVGYLMEQLTDIVNNK